jgi:hypothetical protein
VSPYTTSVAGPAVSIATFGPRIVIDEPEASPSE